MEEQEKLTKDAVMIAKKAGAYLLENFKKDVSLYMRRGLSKEVTTEYDLKADEIIISKINEMYPSHAILAEESGKKEGKDEYLWIVDSMDGSGNFAAGNPFFSVSIGIMKGSNLIIGVVFAPYLDELYVAQKGKGASLNGKEINVSAVDDISSSYIVACEGGSQSNERMNKLFSAIYPDVKDMRKLGSAALEAGFVASGRAEAFTTLEISPWDVAAGILIVKEAGGSVSDFKGDVWKCENSDVVMSNTKLHEELLKRIQDL